jgi:hypothetical protein
MSWVVPGSLDTYTGSLTENFSGRIGFLDVFALRDQLVKDYESNERLEHGRGVGVASGEFFGYAQSVTASGRYEGLKFGEVGVTVYMDESSVLVHPDTARRQIESESEKQKPVLVSGDGEEGQAGEGENGEPGGESPIGGGTISPEPIEDLSTSFHGIVEIDPARLGGSAGAISQEVVQRLASILGANVRVTLEIKADVPNGIPEKVERDISENCNTLRFREYDFRE